MARYDKATAEFINKFADTPQEQKTENIIRKVMTVAGAVAAKRPATIGPTLVKTVANQLTEKTGGLSVIKVYQLLNDKFGRDWWDWEPETIWSTLQTDFDSSIVEEDLKNMVMALQMVLNSHAAHEHWHVFEKVGHAFNRNIVDFSTIQPLELNEVVLTLRILDQIRPKENFETEICGYIASCAKNSGVVYLPTDLFLKDCQKNLDDLGNDEELRDEVRGYWPKNMMGDTALAIQLQRLKEIEVYANS